MSFSSVIDNLLLSRDVGRFRKMKFGSDIQFAEFDKYLIRYKLCGSGYKTVVFIPNAPNTIEHYDKLAQLLAQNFQVLIFELPGFGFSVPKRANYDYSLETMTQVGIDLLDRLQIKDTIFALSCLGGYITLKTAEIRPDLVGNIVSIQTLCWDEQKEWAERINKRLPIKTPILGQILSRILRSKITKQW
jgi:pimeloyl-ACP methyl ester carboxylesterase